MKNTLGLLTAFIMIVLSGCALLQEANNTLTYINEATDFLTEANQFAADAPDLARQAVQDNAAAMEFEETLQFFQQVVENFNRLTPPSVAEDLHQQIVNNNETVLSGINLYLDAIENGKLNPAILENTELFQTITELSGIVQQIKELQN
jgi:hypothetical protein